MGYPRDRSDRIVHLGRKEMDEMSDEELRRCVHELEVKAYVLEGTVKVTTKSRGVEGLGNEERARADRAPAPQNITATELFGAPWASVEQLLLPEVRPERMDAYAGAARPSGGVRAGARGRVPATSARGCAEGGPIRISGKKVRSSWPGGLRRHLRRKRRRYSSYKGRSGMPREPRRARLRADALATLAHRRDAVRIPAGKAYLSP